MKILITGANLINKGAQSMLYVTVDQMKRIFPGCIVYYATYRGDSVKDYAFERIYWDPFVKKAIINGSFSKICWLKQTVKNTTKYVLRRTNEFNSVRKSLSLVTQIDLILDISGYALSDKWGYSYNEAYLDNIRIAKILNIPIILMPQSFGPFDYEVRMDQEKANKIKKDIQELLAYPRLIFARESQSKSNLEKLGVTNAILSNDLVLQSKSLIFENIFTDANKRIKKRNAESNKKSIAFIPNQQIAKRGYKDKLLKEYRIAIKNLTERNYKVIIMRHSSEDAPLCREIYDCFKHNANVEYVNEDQDCYEFCEYIKDFCIVVSSRFHAAVHAIKEDVPTITVGWAVKYSELMDHVGLGKYALDITDRFETGLLNGMLMEMIGEYDGCKEIIYENLKRIQSKNCFDTLKEVLNS